MTVSRKWNMFLLLMAVVLLLTGCNMHTVSDLYCLPMRSEEHNNLQSLIQSAMTDREYSAPLTGDNQQTVQAVDLNGDGTSEYLLFARDSSDKPLKIFVFSGDGANYELLSTIESTGSAFDQVEFVQMDGRPGYELVVGRQVSDQVVRSVSVYTFKGNQLEQAMTVNYSEFLCCDLNSDGKNELFILQPGETANGTAVVYSMNKETLDRSQEVSMSEPAENIMRLMSGKLCDGLPAVYVASAVGDSNGIITDVYALIDGQLTNVSLSNESGTSVQTLRNYYIYADDIDDDGVLELPSLISMRSPERAEQRPDQYIIRWYSMTSGGEEVDKMYTYHNFVGGWYLRLDDAYARRIYMEQKGSSYEFSLWDEHFTQMERLMTVYVLTGQKREEQALSNNRFVLYRGESTVYAAGLDVASAAYELTQESLIGSFHLILQDWKTGET